MSETLLAAIDRGELTTEQLAELISEVARQIGLSFDDAVRAARADRLPRSVEGDDLRLLTQLLPAHVAA